MALAPPGPSPAAPYGSDGSLSADEPDFIPLPDSPASPPPDVSAPRRDVSCRLDVRGPDGRGPGINASRPQQQASGQGIPESVVVGRHPCALSPAARCGDVEALPAGAAGMSAPVCGDVGAQVTQGQFSGLPAANAVGVMGCQPLVPGVGYLCAPGSLVLVPAGQGMGPGLQAAAAGQAPLGGCQVSGWPLRLVGAPVCANHIVVSAVPVGDGPAGGQLQALAAEARQPQEEDVARVASIKSPASLDPLTQGVDMRGRNQQLFGCHHPQVCNQGFTVERSPSTAGNAWCGNHQHGAWRKRPKTRAREPEGRWEHDKFEELEHDWRLKDRARELRASRVRAALARRERSIPKGSVALPVRPTPLAPRSDRGVAKKFKKRKHQYTTFDGVPLRMSKLALGEKPKGHRSDLPTRSTADESKPTLRERLLAMHGFLGHCEAIARNIKESGELTSRSRQAFDKMQRWKFDMKWAEQVMLDPASRLPKEHGDKDDWKAAKRCKGRAQPVVKVKEEPGN
ncbi:unnamed protein product [Ostreobium quekettii]|uniref:Uncharacterized protein n=1 Tax=Ostreobium quekettii TaxID=121088 RepID=A0A8S1JB66_9CHLO|nr:unnamed protein product [Ostreobium quekettii]|eukprot:evm.model.scf_169EXC.4 EVM.evm.TU.scf_169EXC.4   scf_169EXC:69289-74160(-)